MFYFQKQINNIDVDIYRANEFYINLKIVCFFILGFSSTAWKIINFTNHFENIHFSRKHDSLSGSINTYHFTIYCGDNNKEYIKFVEYNINKSTLSLFWITYSVSASAIVQSSVNKYVYIKKCRIQLII